MWCNGDDKFKSLIWLFIFVLTASNTKDDTFIRRRYLKA
nr:MAG TPA: hypothetical protein [Caudoviricetes sp.]